MRIKQQLVEWGRNAFRAMPISLARRRQIQDWVFATYPSLFKHLPAYQMWLMQHPEYAIAQTPWEQLDSARKILLATGAYRAEKPGILMVSHSLGGGTETHLQALSKRLEAEGMQVWALRSLGRERVRLLPYHAVMEEGLVFDRTRDFAELVDQLDSMNIKHLHVHHTVDFGDGILPWITRLAHALEIKFDFTLHDYFSICPRYTLYDDGARGYCGEPEVKRCTGCVKSFGSAAGFDVDMPRWRAQHLDFLQQARAVYAPDEDVQNRMMRYVPEVNLQLRPHWDDTPITPLIAPRQPGEPLRIVTLGAIAPHKGSAILYECAADARARELPLEFTLIGFSDIDYKLSRVMKVTGKYDAEALPQMIREGRYHAAFFPAVWPETFNYTLSEILHFGLFPISFDLGAIARRIKSLHYGAVLDYHLFRRPEAINDALLKLTLPATVPVEALRAAQVSYGSILGDYYGLRLA